MTAQELEERLQPIKDHLTQCEEVGKLLEMLASGSFVAVDFGNGLIQAYMDAISRELGDFGNETWLDWFVWENDFGVRGHECTANGKEYIVKNTADLLEVIEAWKQAQPNKR